MRPLVPHVLNQRHLADVLPISGLRSQVSKKTFKLNYLPENKRVGGAQNVRVDHLSYSPICSHRLREGAGPMSSW